MVKVTKYPKNKLDKKPDDIGLDSFYYFWHNLNFMKHAHA